MAKSYSVWNGTSVTTASPAPVTSGVATTKTMIQLNTSASSELRVIEWSTEGDASAAATPGVAELIFHGSGAATMTAAYVAGDIKKYDPNSRASLINITGATNSGYVATAEGTVAGGSASLPHQIPPTSGIYIQYPLGREPEMAVSTFCRLRTKFAAAVNILCLVAWEE